MKKLIIIAALFAGAASASVTGDKILFQKNSTFVSAAFSKTLCLNEGADQYEAMVTKCMEWRHSDDDRKCVRYEKVFATQPMESTRQRCAHFGGGDDDRCTEWETVPFIQNRVRTVKWYRDNDDNSAPYKVTTVVIPSCN